MTRGRVGFRSLLLASSVLIGCKGREVPSVDPHVVRDSAGVEVVVNRAPELSAGTWTVSREPVAEIGSVEGPGWTMLDRVSDVAQLTDGRIAVVNGGTNELRFYSPDGEFLTAVGGSGEGPGEFQGPWRVQQRGDSLQVFDLALSRVTVFDSGGEVARTETLTWPDARGGVLYLGVLPDGSHLGYYALNLMYTGDVSTTGLYRETSTVVRYPPGATSVETVGRFPGMEVFVVVGGDTPRQTGAPFGNRRLNVLHEEVLTLGYTERYELLQYSPPGQLVRVVRKIVEPEPVTAEDRAAYVETRLRTAPPEIRDAVTFPETHPVFSSLVVDETGNLWVEEYMRPIADGGPSRWSVFDQEGRWLTDIRLPEGLEISFISRDRVLGVWRDELGVEYVRAYALTRGPLSTAVTD